MRYVLKRDGTLAHYDRQKIVQAVAKAFIAHHKSPSPADKVSLLVEHRIKRRKHPSVEQIQDEVVRTLKELGHSSVARAYQKYRERRSEMRTLKSKIGVVDNLKLSVNAIKVLERRYLLKDGSGAVIETTAEMFRRVATAIGIIDLKYDKKADVKKTISKFYSMMSSLEFLPNTPTLMNAGTPIGQLSACFVIPIDDSLPSIFDSLKLMALVHQSGGGTGFSFSSIRPKGDIVNSTKSIASGPVSFMKIFDSATDVIKQGGRRRGANMGVLSVHHPDILDFITLKSDDNLLTNFNISIAVTDSFMRAVEKNSSYPLINPRTLKVVKRLNAKDVFNLIVESAWHSGDPGLLFINEINRTQPTPELGVIESTNPCAEVPLLPYESCNLGSINLKKFVSGGELDWDRLRTVIHDAVHFLDNVIDANKYITSEFESMAKDNRKIGVGVMGFAEALIMLGVRYDSDKALRIADSLMKFINEESLVASIALAKKRGSFPNLKRSSLRKKYGYMRNATTTTIAPTGSISIISNCSSGIEPLFAVSFVRNVMEGTRLIEVNGLFEHYALEQGFYSKKLMREIAKKGSIQHIPGIPQNVKNLFRTAFDISYDWHVKMQAVFQKHTANAVSKTINFPKNASPRDIKKAYMLAYKMHCKGITIFRYGSKHSQVLTIEPLTAVKKRGNNLFVEVSGEYAGSCPGRYCP